MSSRRMRWLALPLLAALLPGLGEAVENAVHLVREGHLAHAAPAGDIHGEPDPEHGCTGTLHLCHCCVSASFVTASLPLAVPPGATRGALTAVVEAPHDAAARDIEHPPRA